MEAGVTAEQLLRLPVRLRGIDIGHAVDVIVDAQAWRVLGFDVLCRDGSHRFLPLTAARVERKQIAVASALTMLAEGELAFYRRRATSVRSLRGRVVLQDGREAGTLDDVVVSPDGAVLELVVADGRTLAPLDSVRVVPAADVSAA